MNSKRFIAAFFLGASLLITPAFAQSRVGGGSHGGGHSSSVSHSSHSSGMSHSSGSSRSSMGSSSSRSSSYSSPSRSASYSSPSRSAGVSSPSRSMNSGISRSSAPARSNSVSTPSRSVSTPSRSMSTSRGDDHRANVGEVRHSAAATAARSSASPARTSAAPSRTPGAVPGRTGANVGGARIGDRSAAARPAGPGHMPPSSRPMHPVFYHPIHHHHCHVHLCAWDPCIYHCWHWPGFWHYCHTYWYDYHVTDVVVVREYVRQNYGTEIITYAISGNYMYALVEAPDGDTYLQVYDENDRVLAEQKVSRKYKKMEIDRENGGCWILKNKDKDPMLFIYADGKLTIYEAE